jgi:hypothetical protein
MDQKIMDFLASEWVIKFIIAFFGLIIIKLIAGFSEKSITRYIKDYSVRIASAN